MSNPLIKLDNIRFRFQGTDILNKINLEFHEGETIIILSKSGHGKTCLLKAAAGLLPLTSGEVSIYGISLGHITSQEWKDICCRYGFVFQDNAFLSNLTVKQNLELALSSVYQDNDQKTIQEVLEKRVAEFHINDILNKRPSLLSQSPMRLASFARALITDPEILFIDEPFVNVDMFIYEYIYKKIKHLQQQKKTMLIVTNNIKLIKDFGQRIIVLNQGQVYLDDSLKEILHKNDPFVNEILVKLSQKSMEAKREYDDLANDLTDFINI